MKTLITILFIFFCSVSYAQTNKTIKDSIFKKGDIVKIPEIIYGMSNPCVNGFTKDSVNLLGDFLISHKNLVAEIACYTDALIGNDSFAMKLSESRAKCVWLYLAYNSKYKLDTNSIKYKGYGKSRLLVSKEQIEKEKTEEERWKLDAINRRTELIILDVK